MSHQPTASDALAATNPSGGLVHWRHVLIHAYGVDADIVNLLADEWKMARSEERRAGKECRSRWSPEP